MKNEETENNDVLRSKKEMVLDIPKDVLPVLSYDLSNMNGKHVVVVEHFNTNYKIVYIDDGKYKRQMVKSEWLT